jgi:cytochrome c2
MRISKHGHRREAVLLAFVFTAGSAVVARAEEAHDQKPPGFSPEAAATFNRRCTACHTYGKGVKVGPDLKGVTSRRKRDWLVKFVRGSSKVIASGDPTATALFAQFKQQRMPDWTDLSEKKVNDILDYLAVGGPDIKPIDERNAQTATAAEVDLGRKLFFGEVRFTYGAQPCSACHAVAGSRWSGGGSLGPDLTTIYYKYEDRALTDFLKRPCFTWASGSTEEYLSPEESFGVKSFLRQAALSSGRSPPMAGGAPGQKRVAEQTFHTGIAEGGRR